MTIQAKSWDQEIQLSIKRDAAKISALSSGNLTGQVKKYNKLNLFIFPLEKYLKKKQRQLNSMEKNKEKQLKIKKQVQL